MGRPLDEDAHGGLREHRTVGGGDVPVEPALPHAGRSERQKNLGGRVRRHLQGVGAEPHRSLRRLPAAFRRQTGVQTQTDVLVGGVGAEDPGDLGFGGLRCERPQGQGSGRAHGTEHGGARVDPSATLLRHLLAVHGHRGADQRVLEPGGRPLRMPLRQQRGCPRHMGSRHGGTGGGDVVLVHRATHGRAGRACGHDPDAGSRNIRIHGLVIRARTAAGERGERVVPVHRADRQGGVRGAGGSRPSACPAHRRCPRPPRTGRRNAG